MRRLWITRISAATKELGQSYSKFMDSLKKNNVELNRKMLSQIAATDAKGFKAISESLK